MKGVCAFALLVIFTFSAAAQEVPPVESPSPSPSPVKPAAEKPDAYKAYKAKRYEEAVSICQDELLANPARRESYVVLGWALQAMGKYSEAFDTAKTGMEKSGADDRLKLTADESLTALYTWLFNQGRLDDALNRIFQFIGFLPASANVPAAYALMGKIYLKKGSYIYADTALSFALRANPAMLEWWVNAGAARESFGDFKSALAAYNEALKIDPAQADALRGRDRVRQKLSSSP